MTFRVNGKIHYGAWVFLVAFAFQFFVVTLQYHAQGQFITPMAEDMGISRSDVMSTVSVTSIVSMSVMLIAGFIFKKVSVKPLLCVCLLLYSGLYALQSLASNLTQVYAIAVFRGAITPFCSMYPLTIVLNNWFGKRVIGKMVTFAMIGNSLGSIVMNPVIGRLIRDFGWRVCYRVIAFVPILMLPLLAFVLVVSPAGKGLSRIGDLPPEEEQSLPHAVADGISVGLAVKKPVFWLSALMFLLWSGSTQVWILLGPSFLSDTGRDPVAVAAVMSVSAVGNLIGKAVLGPLYEKSARNGLVFGFSAGLLAFIIAIASAWIPALAFAASFLFGFCVATVGAVPTIVTSELFGRRDYGVISGYVQIGGNIGSSTLPLLMTLLLAGIGNYAALWGVMCALVSASIILLIAVFQRRAEPS